MTSNEIWHGDSKELIDKIDQPINCLVMDPPYGKDFQSRRAETPEGKRWVRDVEGDKTVEQALADFSVIFTKLANKCAVTSEAYVFTSWDVVDSWVGHVRGMTELTGFAYKMLLIWDKGIPGMGDIDANWGCGHELIIYLKRSRRDVPFRRSGIIHVDKVANMKHIHPTEKPVELIERLLEMSTDPGDLVVDPYSGSGSTSVAAMKMGRNSIGIEKDATYIEPSRARLAQGAMVF